MTSVAQSDAGLIGEVAGRTVTLHYTSAKAEYAALRQSAIVVDRSHRTRMVFEGDRRFETLTGLVTNDVGGLGPGAGLYAAALTPRGKIICDLRIFARESDLLVDVSARAAAGFVAMVRKFVNPRATRYVERSDDLSDVGVFGPRSRDIVATFTGLATDVLEGMAPYASQTCEVHGQPVLVARVPDIGLEGYEIIAPADTRPALWRSAIELGAVPAGLDAWDTARIEAGRPEWGIDIDDTTIPQEANLDDLHAISYTKGCYTGQETVARVHFRGHVNRHLRGLSYPGSVALPRGAQLLGEGDKVIGDVRSSAVSPRLGGIALAMVRREVAPGASVRVQWEGGDGSIASVVQLPFAP
jgi:tRNA-modifying protein YgfZ